MRNELPKGKWKHTLVFDLVDSASSLNLSMSEFMDWKPMDRALLIARNRVKATAQAYEAHLSEEKSKKRSRKKKK